MKIMKNIEFIREVNGGGYYQCRVCGYSNKSYWTTFSHAAGHFGKAYLKVLSWVLPFV